MNASDLTAGHIGSRVQVACDQFGATGVLVGVVAYSTSRAVVLHLADGGCSGTVTLPWNADVELDDDPTSGVWVEEATA